MSRHPLCPCRPRTAYEHGTDDGLCHCGDRDPSWDAPGSWGAAEDERRELRSRPSVRRVGALARLRRIAA